MTVVASECADLSIWIEKKSTHCLASPLSLALNLSELRLVTCSLLRLMLTGSLALSGSRCFHDQPAEGLRKESSSGKTIGEWFGHRHGLDYHTKGFRFQHVSY